MHERMARVAMLRCEDALADAREDAVVREEPLEIRLGGAPLAVVMRTPGDDEELALGFLVSERVVRSPADVASVRHWPQLSAPEAEENAIQVVLAPGVEVDLVQPRYVRRSKRYGGTQRPRSEDDCHERGQRGAECGLRQMLSEDACPSGAERQSNGHLPRTRSATRNRETRHVGADEQEQTRHGAEHEQ